MKHLITLGLFLAGCLLFRQPVWGQQLPATGLELEDEGYQTTEKIPLSGKKARIPESIDLTPFCPIPRHQGSIQSCVGWATGYGALTITYAIRNRIHDRNLLSERAFSALFIYEQIRQGDCERSGSRISDAMQLLKTRGNCLASQYDHEVEKCGTPITPDLLDFAQNFRITGYLKLFDSDDHPTEKVYRLQYALSQHKPVVVGMRIRKNFFKLNAKASYWWPELGDRTPAGGHAMVVVGYDHRRGAFQLMNSWGTSWGQDGFIWVKYREMAAFCKYAYIFKMEDQLDDFWTDGHGLSVQHPPMKPVRQFSAQFSFLYNPCIGSYCGDFSEATVQRSGFIYETNKEQWTIGQQFQLKIINTGQPVYMYVFSHNPEGKISLHWPRPEAFDRPLQIPSGQDIVIPGPQRAMRISQSGTNYLVLLLSQKPLGDPVQLLGPLQNSGDQLPQRLFQILEKHIFSAPDIQLQADRMHLNVRTRSDKSMIPLILKIEGTSGRTF